VGRVRGRRDLARKGLAGGRAREAAFAALGNHTDSLDAYYKLVVFFYQYSGAGSARRPQIMS
jgi:hypothetical protein